MAEFGLAKVVYLRQIVGGLAAEGYVAAVLGRAAAAALL